jgi:signal transduction histidine kinase
MRETRMKGPERDEQLIALAAHLAGRREAILEKWRDAIESDSKLTTASTLSRSQFYDHIPAVLNAFERDLGAHQSADARVAQKQQTTSAALHGLQRWHHGYDQEEVMREWGHLHRCLVNELEDYGAALSHGKSDAMRFARRALAELCSNGVIESASGFARMQQAEAAGRVRDLEEALAQLKELERKRAETWREAAHDLRGNLGVVKNVTKVLNQKEAPEQLRTESLNILQMGVASLHALLDDLILLSRLEAGGERRRIETLDAAVMLDELCTAMKSLADDRGLFLQVKGPASLIVQGDAVKIRRIAQNLLLNALKYTEQGGVRVIWEELDVGGLERWTLEVQDTGPGFQNGQATPLVPALKESTEEAHAVETTHEAERPFTQPDGLEALSSVSAHKPADHPPGEGIGLSIVKRLCGLLDATMEFESERGNGSTFRIIFPRRYDAP